MKRIIHLLILFFLVYSFSYSQHYRVGAGFGTSLPTSYTEIGGGVNFFVEYISTSPFSFRTSGGFAISKFNNENHYLEGKNYFLYWLEGSLMYYPFKEGMEIGLGPGFGYYAFDHEEFNAFENSISVYVPGGFSNKITYHIYLSLSYPVHESIKLNLQAKYLFLYQNLVAAGTELVNNELIQRTIDNEFNLSNLNIFVGVILRI